MAYIDGTTTTNLRTGAAAVASKHLARKDSRSLGLVGAGEQAKTQLMCISEVFDLREVLVYDVNREAVDDLIARFPKFDISKRDLNEVVSSDIVSTTTPVRTPIVKREWGKAGSHINAMGADAKGKEELEPGLLVGDNVRVIVDDMVQALHSGEINVPVSKGLFAPEKVYGQLSDIVVGKLKGRKDTEITIFDSTGLAIQDIATAKVIYEKALSEGIGLRI